MILNRFILLLGLLLALSGPQSLPAASQAGDSISRVVKDLWNTGVKPPGGSDKAEPAGDQLQLAAALGQEVPLWLEDAWQQNPQDLQLGLSLLQYYRKQHDTTRALELARKLHTVHPGNTEVLKALVIALLDSGNTDATLGDFREKTSLPK